MKVMTLCLAVVIGCSQVVSADINGTAAHFYPAALMTCGDETVPAQDRETKAIAVDLNANGHSLIVAAYGNGLRGAVAVIDPATPAVLSLAAPVGMVGRHFDVRAMDLDGDKRPEIVLEASLSRGLPAVWLYRWSGTALQALGPFDSAAPDLASSALTDPTFVDLDGDGVVDIIDHKSGIVRSSETSDGEPEDLYATYTVVNGVVGAARPVDMYREFDRGQGTPAEQSVTFSLTDLNTEREIVILNGDADGKNRVSSATVSINGKPIVLPDSFNQKVRRLAVFWKPEQSKNTLQAELRSNAGGEIAIIVRPK